MDQDPLGKQATRVKEDPATGREVWMRPLADGTIAVGLFNRGRYEIEPPSRVRGISRAGRKWKLRDRATGKTESSMAEADAEPLWERPAVLSRSSPTGPTCI